MIKQITSLPPDVLTGYNLFGLALKFKCSTADVIDDYCELYEDSETKLPMIRVLPYNIPTIRKLLETVEPDENNVASDAFMQAILRISPILQLAHKTRSQDIYHNLFNSVFSFLYLMYDMDEDFTEQCTKNTDIFLEGANATGIYNI
jgi:hypothetical protein